MKQITSFALLNLKRELLWDGANMKFTNISATDEIKVLKSDKFAVIDGHPHFDTQLDTIPKRLLKSISGTPVAQDGLYNKR